MPYHGQPQYKHNLWPLLSWFLCLKYTEGKDIIMGKTEGLLKIGEVAKAADISVTTVKYYVKEGLVDIALKTGRNMAYYAPESVERVRLIKALQSKKYYPLSVIRHMLKNGSTDAREEQLLDIINKADKSDYYEQISVAEAALEAGLKKSEAEALIRAGLIIPISHGRARMCCRGDLRIMKLAKTRMDAGMPLEQTIKTFSMYETYLREATRQDIESLVKDGIVNKKLSTEDIVNIINVSDETLDSFIGMKRYAMNAAIGADYVAKTVKLLALLGQYGQGVCSVLGLLGYNEAKQSLEKALECKQASDRSLSRYCEMLSLEGTGIANTLSILHRVGAEYKKPEPSTNDLAMDMTKQALRLGWLSFAPSEFGCDAEAAKKEFAENIADKSFVGSVLQLLNKLQNENI